MSKKDVWFTFSDASRKINKNRNYFFNRYKSSPEYFDPETIKIIGGIKFINECGIDFLLKNIKKNGRPLKKDKKEMKNEN